MNEYVNPHDTDLEEAVIGACLIESKAITLVDDKLCPEVFYEEKNREIYAAIQSMYRAGRSIDVITVKEELAQRGRLDAVGGPYTVMRISSRVASSAHLEYHAEILKQKYIRREMILGCNKLLALACDESTDITDTLVDAHSLLDRLENEYGTTDHLRSMEQLMKDTVGQVETRVASNRDGVTGIPTGFTDLNRMTAGWQPGDEVIIAARPSVGKTAFALHLARTAATAGHQVLVYSLEMQGERLGDRWLLAACPEVNAEHLRTGQLNPTELRLVHETSAELAKLPIYIDDNASVSMDYIRSSAKLQQSKGQCALIIIDYLQLCDMKTEQHNRNREQEVAQASRKAKMLAKELNVPVLLLSQLNRDCEGRPDGRPALSDLRESGAIEQDADMVLLLHRPALSGRATDRKSSYPTEGLGIAIVAKHRNGETGEVYFSHNKSLTRMGDYAPGDLWMTRNAK
ncbi:replicative DNA helicase [Bacteroides thetaiotaomicron]|uniref:replicative DNA helicase n=1 Tax=Bacteroides thetaiotaomicron TaxID=818 RepID=UPI001CE24C4D|nr:replicative DNA helicase [Bacteroides thetaiotaomicron]MCA6009129.1 replicative DNA helicase [Bacteroides thetaiotaomicron]UVS51789.1 replicative DNA helicase [Bacteroides thetaiotaomicron]